MDIDLSYKWSQLLVKLYFTNGYFANDYNLDEFINTNKKLKIMLPIILW